MATDKIKRAITWIRKSLEITEKTTNPGTVDGNIVPVIDTFGWERLGGPRTTRLTQGIAVNVIASPAVPADVLRVILEANVETNDGVQQFTFWIDHQHVEAGQPVGVMRPITPPISALTIRCAMDRKFLIMRPGDTLLGRSSPAPGVGLILRLRESFVDLPIGEYIHSL